MNELQIKHLVEGMRRLLLQWNIDLSKNNADSKFYDTDAKILAEQNLQKYGEDFQKFISAHSMGCYRFLVENYEKFLVITASETGTTKNLSPFDAGKKAFIDGKSISDNPYSGKEPLMCGESADQWVSGWLSEKENSGVANER